MYRIPLLTLLVALPLTLACGEEPPPVEETRLPLASIDVRGRAMVGETLTFDGRASHDPDGATVSFVWWIGEAPAGSGAALVGEDAPEATLVPDRPGEYEIWLAVEDPDGRGEPASARIDVVEATSRPVAQASFAPLYPTAHHPVELRSESWDREGDAIRTEWRLDTPSSSQAKLADADAEVTSFVPDVPGSYYVELVASDDEGPGESQRLNVVVAPNAAPIAGWTWSGNARVGQAMSFDANGCTDPEGDALSFEWTATGPAGSTAVMTDAGSAVAGLVPDRPGLWCISLTVGDGWSTSQYARTLEVSPHSVPQAALSIEGLVRVDYYDRALVGQSVVLDGTGSTDGSSHTFTRVVWDLELKPEGSAAALDGEGLTATVVPDLAGAYRVRLTVEDAEGLTATATAAFDARALTVVEAVDQVAVDVRYSRVLDRAVIAYSQPAQLAVFDPAMGHTTSIDLPKAALALALTPDGRRAVVGHDGWISLIDLESASVLRSLAVPLRITSVDTDGVHAWTVGGSSSNLQTIELADGSRQEGVYASGSLVRVHPAGDRAYVASSWIRRVTLDEGGVGTDSTHISENACSRLWLSESGLLLFTGCGTAYHTDASPAADLAYAGSFGQSAKWVDHDASSSRIAVLAGGSYNSAGTLFLADDLYFGSKGEVILPGLLVDGRVQYASDGWVFFDASGETLHVFLTSTDGGLAHEALDITDLVAGP